MAYLGGSGSSGSVMLRAQNMALRAQLVTMISSLILTARAAISVHTDNFMLNKYIFVNHEQLLTLLLLMTQFRAMSHACPWRGFALYC